MCLGNDKCEQGYAGLLCENCDHMNGYSKELGAKKCRKCTENKTAIIFNLFMVCFLFSLFIFNQIYGIMIKINKYHIMKGFSKVFNMNFNK